MHQLNDVRRSVNHVKHLTTTLGTATSANPLMVKNAFTEILKAIEALASAVDDIDRRCQLVD